MSIFETFIVIYNERKTWESRLILHSIEIYQVKSFHCQIAPRQDD